MLTEGTIVNGVCKVAPKLISVVRRSYELRQTENLFQVDLAQTQLLSPLRPHLDRIAALLAAEGTTQQQLDEFLQSQDFECFIRRVLISQLKPAIDADHLLATKLRTLIVEHGLAGDSPVVDTLALSFLAALMTSTALMWQTALEKGVIAQEVAAVCVNTRLLSDELNALRAELSSQVILSPVEYRAYEKFLGNYRDSVGSTFRYITHPNFTDNSPIPFDGLYVAANFLEYKDSFATGNPDQHSQLPTREHELLTPEEVLGISFRTVILGNPGAGKSTFAAKLCHDLWKYPADPIFSGRVLIPVLVILRDYAKNRKEHPSSILEYIEQRARVDYQQVPPQNAFHRLFLTGRALVIFDGLDELLDTADRLEIKNAVERFSNLYPSVAILVTSREVGYEQAPLDPALFSVFKLLPFNDDQVQQYVSKWFPICSHGTKAQREERARQFLSESSIIKDLRQNPLMLALLCNLYKQDGYLPRYRPDIYQRCADLLFEKWDKGRQISADIPVDYHLRPIMCHLAHWIYKNEELQMGVTEGQLISETTEYLREFFEYEARARSYAKLVVEFFRGRAWVFSDTGSNENERLYQFTHRTFLEYFTAEYLVGSSRGPDGLGATLLPHIEKREWDTVSQLAYQMQAKSYKEAADDLLKGLLARSTETKNKGKSLNLILFALRSLAIMHPKLEIRKSVVFSGLDLLIRNLEVRSGGGTIEENLLQEIGQVLASLEDESGKPIADMILGSLKTHVQSSDRTTSIGAMEVLYMLPTFLENNLNDLAASRAKHEHWENAIKNVIREFSPLIKTMCKESRSLALTCWWRSELTFSELLADQGSLIIFASRQVAYQSSHYISIAGNLYWDLIGQRDSHDRFLGIVEPVLESLLELTVPWKISSLAGDFDRISIDVFHRSEDTELRWPDDPSKRSAVALLSVVYGTTRRKRAGRISSGLTALSQLHHLRQEISKHTNKAALEQVDVLVDRLDLLPSATKLMRQWVKGEIDLSDQTNVSGEEMAHQIQKSFAL